MTVEPQPITQMLWQNRNDDEGVGIQVEAPSAVELWITVQEDDEDAGISLDRVEARQVRDALTTWLGEG